MIGVVTERQPTQLPETMASVWLLCLASWKKVHECVRMNVCIARTAEVQMSAHNLRDSGDCVYRKKIRARLGPSLWNKGSCASFFVGVSKELDSTTVGL